MIVLGLGSNVGDRLGALRQALAQLKKIPRFTVQQVSPVYISDALMPEGAPLSWNLPYLNCACRCDSELEPEALLAILKKIELDCGRVPGDKWAPRPVDIDILAWGDLVRYDKTCHIPHEQLHTRPFALWPLADVAPRWIYPLTNEFYGKTAAAIGHAWGSRLTGDAPFHTRQIAQRIDTPQLMGIINITPDSFSDGDPTFSVTRVLQHCETLVNTGAEILDFGAEATSPGAALISPAQEWQRLEAILPAVIAQKNRYPVMPKISVDTRHPETAKQVLALGVDWINDVSGLKHHAMRTLIADQNCDVVVMHELGLPASAQSILPLTQNPLEPVFLWAENIIALCAKNGIARERMIIDVGIGFGKNAEQSLELLQEIAVFKQLDVRLLIGHSRKSFLQQFTLKTAAERDVETLPISLYLADQGIDYLRLHNVDMCARAFKVSRTFTRR